MWKTLQGKWRHLVKSLFAHRHGVSKVQDLEDWHPSVINNDFLLLSWGRAWDVTPEAGLIMAGSWDCQVPCTGGLTKYSRHGCQMAVAKFLDFLDLASLKNLLWVAIWPPWYQDSGEEQWLWSDLSKSAWHTIWECGWTEWSLRGNHRRGDCVHERRQIRQDFQMILSYVEPMQCRPIERCRSV